MSAGRFTPFMARLAAHIVRYPDGRHVGIVRTPQSVLMRTISYTNATRAKFDVMKWYVSAAGKESVRHIRWYAWQAENAEGIMLDCDGTDRSEERIFQP